MDGCLEVGFAARAFRRVAAVGTAVLWGGLFLAGCNAVPPPAPVAEVPTREPDEAVVSRLERPSWDTTQETAVRYEQLLQKGYPCAVRVRVRPAPIVDRTRPANAQGRPDSALVDFDYVLVPNGEYTVAGAAGRKKRVVISKPFYLAATELTVAQWCVLAAPEATKAIAPSQHPFEPMSHDTALKLAEYARAELPTEAEWEYACAFGGHEAQHPPVDEIAVCAFNSGGATAPVRSKRPNALGLYDMLGNVAEWCRDGFVEDRWLGSSEETVTDPRGTALRQEQHVFRGGDCGSAADELNAFARQSASHRYNARKGARLKLTGDHVLALLSAAR